MRVVVLLAALAATHPTLDCAHQPAACQAALAWSRERRRHDARQIHRLRARLHHLEHPPQASIPHLSAWLCIHRGEGPWDADTGNGYYGGLQFDSTFEQAYGAAYVARWGHANNWRPRIQMLTAENAWRTRGYAPWPQTARMCGLLP